MRIRREIINPAGLGTEERRKLLLQLHALNTRIFSGADPSSFGNTVISPPASWTRIQVLRDEAGACVGYEALHRYHFVLLGCERIIFRAQAGILKPYRGQGASFPFAYRQALRYKLCHPWARVYLFVPVVHPSSFHLLASHCHELHPGPFRAVPLPMQVLIREMALAFHERLCADASGPAISLDDWVTIDDDDETAFWQSCTHPDVRFFLQVNPGYGQGHALLTLVPVSWKNLLFALLPGLVQTG